MTGKQKMICTKCHESVSNAIDELIPGEYLSRSEFVLKAVLEKFEHDNIVP